MDISRNTKKVEITPTRYGYKDALFRRIDVYYCEKCCEIKKVEQTEKVFRTSGINMEKDAPIWY